MVVNFLIMAFRGIKMHFFVHVTTYIYIVNQLIILQDCKLPHSLVIYSIYVCNK